MEEKGWRGERATGAVVRGVVLFHRFKIKICVVNEAPGIVPFDHRASIIAEYYRVAVHVDFGGLWGAS